MKRRRLLTVILSAILLFAFPLSAFAAKPTAPAPTAIEYVGLGDSIGYGMSSTPGNSYFDKFSFYLSQKATPTTYTSSNEAWPGLTTKQLLDEIQGVLTVETPVLLTDSKAELPGATVVTISIGANNLMAPLLRLVGEQYDITYGTPTFLAEITNAINTNPGPLNAWLPWQILWPYSELQVALRKGVSDFKLELPKIISNIKLLTPKTKIYLLTVYNPVYGNADLRNFIDTYIDQINAEIKAKASTYGYTSVDVYTAFENYTGTLPLVGFNMAALPPTYDPHPLDAGHELIFQLLKTTYELPAPVKGRK